MTAQISNSALDTRHSTLAISTWTPISDALPPVGAVVLVWTGNRHAIAARLSRWLELGTGKFLDPTHWQHLPLPPKPFTNYQ